MQRRAEVGMTDCSGTVLAPLMLKWLEGMAKMPDQSRICQEKVRRCQSVVAVEQEVCDWEL